MSFETTQLNIDEIKTPSMVKINSASGVEEVLLISSITKSKTMDTMRIVTGSLITESGNVNYFRPLPNSTIFEVLNKAAFDEINQKSKNSTNLFSRLGCRIGADPEIFTVNDKGDIIYAFEYLGDKLNKEHPSYFRDTYADGFAAEFTVAHQSCLGYLCDEVQLGLKRVYTALQKVDKTATLSNKSFIEIPLDFLETLPEKYSQLGCAPSKNAYGLEVTQVLDGKRIPYRSCGGHMHFGFSGYDDYNCSEEKIKGFVKALDAILGVACVSLFANYDNPLRREYYGLAGEYRTTSYGFEYRTLSNAWLIHPILMNIVYDLGRASINIEKLNLYNKINYDQDKVVKIIQSCDVDMARSFIKDNGNMFLALLKTYYTKSASDFVLTMILNGLESWVKDPNDIVGNWKIDSKWTTHCDGKEKNVVHTYSANMKGLEI